MTLDEEISEKGLSNREESAAVLDKTPLCRKLTY